MKILLTSILTLALAWAAAAQACPPRPDTSGAPSSWVGPFQAWCECCGGTFSSHEDNGSGHRCNPGSAWDCEGGGQPGGMTGSDALAQALIHGDQEALGMAMLQLGLEGLMKDFLSGGDAAAAAKRRQELAALELERLRQEEERQTARKQRLMGMLKGFEGQDPGLKGGEEQGGLALKGMDPPIRHYGVEETDSKESLARAKRADYLSGRAQDPGNDEASSRLAGGAFDGSVPEKRAVDLSGRLGHKPSAAEVERFDRLSRDYDSCQDGLEAAERRAGQLGRERQALQSLQKFNQERKASLKQAVAKASPGQSEERSKSWLELQEAIRAEKSLQKLLAETRAREKSAALELKAAQAQMESAEKKKKEFLLGFAKAHAGDQER